VTTYRDQAVVLRKLDYGEADRIYTLLTREHGKVGAIAKGVRRTTSKLASSLGLYSHVDVLLAQGRNLDVVAQASLLPGARLAAELERTAHAALIAELAERVTEDRHPVDGIYELTVLALEELARETQPRRASAYFLSQALEILGYAPQVSDCAGCGQPLRPVPSAFSPGAGGFLCMDCAEPGMILVSVAALKVLRLMAAGEIAMYRRLRLEPAVLLEVENVLEAQLEHHLDRRLKSLDFLRSMR
jgi:DNA repair protein RecO (recombination protein O)